MLNETDRCPKCGAVGTGATIRGVYDGALYWFCARDSTRWHRWPVGSPLWRKAESYVEVMK